MDVKHKIVNSISKADEAFIRRIVLKTVGPLIMNNLEELSKDDFHTFLSKKEDGALLKTMVEDEEYSSRLKAMFGLIPMGIRGKAKKIISDRKWLLHFVNNEVQHKRPDLYIETIYSPGSLEYLQKEIAKMAEHFL